MKLNLIGQKIGFKPHNIVKYFKQSYLKRQFLSGCDHFKNWNICNHFQTSLKSPIWQETNAVKGQIEWLQNFRANLSVGEAWASKTNSITLLFNTWNRLWRNNKGGNNDSKFNTSIWKPFVWISIEIKQIPSLSGASENQLQF